MNRNCHNLDAYLADDLPTADAAAFREHLVACNECCEAVAEQQWIDNLLQSPLRSELEPTPHNVFASVQTSLSPTDKRWARLLPAVLVVAAALIVAAGWTVLQWRINEEPIHRGTPTDIASMEQPAAKVQPHATFVSNSNNIAVPVKSRHADVTIIRIYPAYQPRYEAQTAAIEPEATTNDYWNIYSNGG